MRVRLPIALLLATLLGGVSSSRAQSPVPGPDERIHYSKVRQFFIPFQVDPTKPIKELRLFVQRDGGAWEFLSAAEPTQKGFNFFTNQDGSYNMAVQTLYQDNSAKPSRDQLRPDLKIVVDTVPPRITLRPFSTPDGAAGVEWDIADDYLDASSIKLEYRWPGNMVDWAPINKGEQLKGRDQRTWVLRPDQRIEIRVRSSDLAKNETISQGVTTSSTIGDNRQFNGSTSGGAPSPSGGDTAVAPRVNGTQHFVNHKTLTFHYNVKVGPSGIKKVTLWMLDEKNVWSEVESKSGNELVLNKDPAAVVPGEQPRTETLALEHTVEKDGVYGFMIIAESRAGTSARAPRPGDPPHTTVVVDTTPPVVKMTEPKVRPNGTAAQGALVDIIWEATDKNLAAAPITLEYADKLDGTWRVIVDKIDNAGKYTWAVPPTETYSFYIRVKAIDRAGNITTATSKEPVIVDLTVPQVEIRDVAPPPMK